MSVEYDFKIKKQGQPVWEAPVIGYLCTSDAYFLYENALYFDENPNKKEEYDGWQILTRDNIAHIQKVYDNYIERSRSYAVNLSVQADNLLEMMPKSVNETIFNRLRTEYDEVTEAIEDQKEYQENLQGIRDMFLDFESIMSINEDDNFEIVYYYG